MERTKTNLTVGAIAISVAATFLLAPAIRAQDAGTTPVPATTTAPPADPTAQANARRRPRDPGKRECTGERRGSCEREKDRGHR